MHTGKLSVRYGMLRELIGLLVFCITKNKLEYNLLKCTFNINAFDGKSDQSAPTVLVISGWSS